MFQNTCTQFMTSLATAALIAACATATAQSEVTGRVFNDANGNGIRDSGESGVRGVGVSNGRDIVTTSSNGSYTLPIATDDVIFVIKPSGWRTSADPKTNLPRFYYVHKPEGSPDSKFPGVAPTGPLPESLDFGLQRQREPNTFEVVFFGDPQPRNVQEVDYIAHDIVEELVGTDAAFGVTLGDIVFNDLSVFEPLNGVVGTIGIPWYNVIGNHDINYDYPDDKLSDETFERIYGPNYYAFNYSDVHFLVLDNVWWDGDGYHGEFGEEQLAFIEADLARVPESRLVVLMMHIPLPTVDDRDKFLGLLEGRPNTLSISAHWHRQGIFSMGEAIDFDGEHPHKHLVHGTVSGSWWGGVPDEYGIPHAMMSDGTPNGYSIGTFRGKQYALRYKAARRPADFQMHVFAPYAVKSSESAEEDIFVNVFMGDDDGEVTYRVGETGPSYTLTRQERPDPYFQQLKEREYYLPRAAGRFLPNPTESTHLWTGPLPANLPVGTHVIYVEATDTFGEEHSAVRILRVE